MATLPALICKRGGRDSARDPVPRRRARKSNDERGGDQSIPGRLWADPYFSAPKEHRHLTAKCTDGVRPRWRLGFQCATRSLVCARRASCPEGVTPCRLGASGARPEGRLDRAPGLRL